MKRPDLRLTGAALAGVALTLVCGVGRSPAAAPRAPVAGVILSPAQAGDDRLRLLKDEGRNTLVLAVTSRDAAAASRAARRAKELGLTVGYWIEVARSPELANAHPEWMASLQGHAQWRRHFPKAPTPAEGEVVKNYPWVPIYYREAFQAHHRRIAALLADLPPADLLFLNDLQAGPSACGCGNTLCRWTTDYGPISTAALLPDDAAAQFVAEVRKAAQGARVIPVWTPECEEHDGAKDGACAGVACFGGACWQALTNQLMPVFKECTNLGAFVPYRELGRDLPRYGPTAGWVRHALRSFAEMPPKRGGQPVPTSDLIAVLQGWDVTPEQRDAQIAQAKDAGSAGYLLSLVKIEQSWEPRLHRPKKSK